jgi:MOSC domain-containing protein YiiM
MHRVLRLWVRPAQDAPLVARDSLEAVAGEGVRGDHAFGRMRHVTILCEDDWNAAAAEIGAAPDASGRRANVLLSGAGARDLLGKTLRIGPVLVEVKGETAPCPVMERAAPGMQKALEPGVRAGVWARIVEGGVIRPGDEAVADPS